MVVTVMICRIYGAHVADQPGGTARARPDSARVPALRLDREAEADVAIEQRRRLARAGALDREHPKLCGEAAVGGEPARLAAGRQHAMTRHHDRERVSSQCLAHVAGEGAIAE